MATHLFNAMAPIHHREPGPIVALLEDPRVTVEVVLDGVHLHPVIYGHVVAAAGPDRVALVTDAIAAAGLADGDYVLGQLKVRVTDGLPKLADQDTIAGSTATTDQLFRQRGAVQRFGPAGRPARRRASDVGQPGPRTRPDRSHAGGGRHGGPGRPRCRPAPDRSHAAG